LCISLYASGKGQTELNSALLQSHLFTRLKNWSCEATFMANRNATMGA